MNMGSGVEAWCNRVAAELLVPLTSIAEEYVASPDLTTELDRLAKFYKVSTLVVLRRIYDAGLMAWDVYGPAYEAELARVLGFAASTSSGGNFYYTELIRVSRTFARALVTDTAEGRTLHRDAFRLLGLKMGDRGRVARRDSRLVPPRVGPCGHDDRCPGPRLGRPGALVDVPS